MVLGLGTAVTGIGHAARGVASVLRGAPHTAEAVIADEWTAAYSRELAAFPVPALRRDKYFSPVRRIDNAYGDRNVQCSCPPVEDFV